MLIIAPCSSKKCIPTPQELYASSIYASDYKEFSEKWVARINTAKHVDQAQYVYSGVGFNSVKSAADRLQAELSFVSAGMSLVKSSKKIPGYNLTISQSGPNPSKQVEKGGSYQDWWRALNNAFGFELPLYQKICEQDDLVLVSLPANYLKMVEAELVQAVANCSDKLRIITSSKVKLNDALNKVAIRYDQRLNTASPGPSGANASFSQRALLNFSRIIVEHSAHTAAVNVQQQLVENSFKHIAPVGIHHRKKVSKTELLTIIKSTLSKERIGPTKLLETIRTSQGIACEQDRFRKAYNQVMEMDTNG